MPDERSPQHKVVLTQPIYLSVHEVSQKDYEAVMGVNPSHFRATGLGKEAVVGLNTATHPVELVSWSDAAEFCTKLSQQEKLKPFYVRVGETVTPLDGTGYGLPTEAEWEFACRAGTTTKCWIGDQDEDLTPAGWFYGNSGGRTHAAGELKGNPFGLYDIHGNVWEWVQDTWEPIYYGEFQVKPALDPKGPSSAGSYRVLRGGEWSHGPARGRAAGRHAGDPTYRGSSVGFRVSLTIDAVKAALASKPVPAKAPFDAKQARAHQEAWARHLGTTVETTNSVGAKMILIPPGEFLMGAPDDDDDAQSQEKPQHKVRLTKPFHIGATEVTVGQFRKFVEATKYVTQAESDGLGAFAVDPKERRAQLIWNKSGPEVTDEHPVRFVSWEDARQFCEWLGRTESLTYRLPTDAEWEYACRAGTTTRYSFGNSFDEAQVNASKTSRAPPLMPSGRFPANPFGLFDMHGNVNEICWDGGREFSQDESVDPVGSLDARQPAVVRGGAISSYPARLRSSQRYINDSRVFPEVNFATTVKGFRVVAVEGKAKGL